MISGYLSQQNPLMRQTDKKKWRILNPLFFILFSGSLLGAILYRNSRTEDIKVSTYTVGKGWGYQIIVKDKVFIDQPFIPVLPGKIPFPDKRAAYRTGRLVKKRLLNHEPPAITRDDLIQLELDHVDNANNK